MSSAVTPNDPMPPEPTPVPTPSHTEVLGRSLRYEIAGEEGRALLSSYALSFALGIAGLVFVYFGPRTLPMPPPRLKKRRRLPRPYPKSEAAAVVSERRTLPPSPARLEATVLLVGSWVTSPTCYAMSTSRRGPAERLPRLAQRWFWARVRVAREHEHRGAAA
jgi:hypothetical protein